MAKSNKWIEYEKADAAAIEFVRLALQDRLETVAACLAPAANEADADGEHVHQLRVASRRAAAALRAVENFVAHRRAKKMRKRLRTIRRAAGDARDLDVLAARYSAQPASARQPLPEAGLDWLWTTLVSRRRAAQGPLEQLNREFGEGRLLRYADRMLGRVKWRGDGNEPTFAELAQAKMSEAADEFFAAASKRPTAMEDLHQLRIAGKHLRYSIELFASALGPSVRDEVYPVIEEIQERLGAVNDHAAAAERIEGWIGEIEGGAEQRRAADALAAHEEQAAEKLRDEFLTWWTAERAEALQRQIKKAVKRGQ